MKRRSALSALSIVGVAALALSACGGDTGGTTADGEFAPASKVRMIVPFSAGGGSDLSGRAMADGLEEVSGSSVTVENLVGGSGAVGYAEFQNSAGDPNTLLASETALVTLPIVQDDVDFTYEDFTPIMKVGEDYNLVIVAGDSPYESCADVVEDAKGNELTAAVSGATGPDHIAWSLIEQQKDISLQRVTFESSSEVVGALLGGHVDVAAASPGEITGQLESGDIKALCALAPERYEYEGLSDIPTGAEQGIDVTFAQWRGFLAPGDISPEARDYWIATAKEFEKTPAYTEYIESNMMQPQTAYGDEFEEYLADYTGEVESVLG